MVKRYMVGRGVATIKWEGSAEPSEVPNTDWDSYKMLGSREG